MKARWKDFWTHTTPVTVRPDLGPCWEWQGSQTSSGYCQLMVEGKSWLVHRYAWTLVHGPIPDDLLVLHNCDNRRCIKPSHLRLGTYSDNQQDMADRTGSRILHAPGRSNPAAKLTWEQVEEIREEVAEVLEGEALYGVPKRGYLSRIARRYGVDRSTISAIVKGRTWKPAHREAESTEINRGGYACSGERLCTSPRDRRVKV
jgi:HNH endonuclease